MGSLYEKYGDVAQKAQPKPQTAVELEIGEANFDDLIGKEHGYPAFASKIEDLTGALDAFAADPLDKEASKNLRTLMIDAQEILRTDEQAARQLLDEDIRLIVKAQRKYFEGLDRPRPKAKPKAKAAVKPKAPAKPKPPVLAFDESLFE